MQNRVTMWILFWPAHLGLLVLKTFTMKSFKSDYFYIFQICTRLLWPMPTGKVERGMKQLSLICILGKIHLKESLLYLLVWKSALNLSKTSNSQSVVWVLYYTYHCKWKSSYLHLNDIDKSYLFFQHSYIYFIVYIFRYQLLKNSFTRKYWGWIFWLSSKSNNWRGTTYSNRWRNGSFPQSSPHLHRGTSPRGSANGDTSTESR